jgi:hypothetical protein
MENILACVLMAAISLPVSLLLARTCLKGVLRIVTADHDRTVQRSML